MTNDDWLGSWNSLAFEAKGIDGFIWPDLLSIHQTLNISYWTIPNLVKLPNYESLHYFNVTSGSRIFALFLISYFFSKITAHCVPTIFCFANYIVCFCFWFISFNPFFLSFCFTSFYLFIFLNPLFLMFVFTT